MPLTNVNLIASLKFDLKKVVLGWPDAKLSGNAISFDLRGIDLTVYDQAYALVRNMPPGDTVTIDLKSCLNLLDEVVAFTGLAALGLQVINGGEVLAEDGAGEETAGEVTSGVYGEVLLAPGAANGLSNWFFKNGMPLLPGESALFARHGSEQPVPVTTPRRTIKVTNTGLMTVQVVLIIIGSTK